MLKFCVVLVILIRCGIGSVLIGILGLNYGFSSFLILELGSNLVLVMLGVVFSNFIMVMVWLLI